MAMGNLPVSIRTLRQKWKCSDQTVKMITSNRNAWQRFTLKMVRLKDLFGDLKKAVEY